MKRIKNRLLHLGRKMYMKRILEQNPQVVIDLVGWSQFFLFFFLWDYKSHPNMLRLILTSLLNMSLESAEMFLKRLQPCLGPATVPCC